MKELIERMAREHAAQDASQYHTEFGQPLGSPGMSLALRDRLLKSWLAVCAERGVTRKETGAFSLSYYPVFSTAYLKVIFGEDEIFLVGVIDNSARTNN